MLFYLGGLMGGKPVDDLVIDWQGSIIELWSRCAVAGENDGGSNTCHLKNNSTNLQDSGCMITETGCKYVSTCWKWFGMVCYINDMLWCRKWSKLSTIQIQKLSKLSTI